MVWDPDRRALTSLPGRTPAGGRWPAEGPDVALAQGADHPRGERQRHRHEEDEHEQVAALVVLEEDDVEQRDRGERPGRADHPRPRAEDPAEDDRLHVEED